MSEIVIAGRTYAVERDRDQYVLTGPRGARYRALRRIRAPHMLYLTNERDWTAAAPRARLTDRGGVLEVSPL